MHFFFKEKLKRKENVVLSALLPALWFLLYVDVRFLFHLAATLSRNMINMLGHNPGPWHRQIIEF